MKKWEKGKVRKNNARIKLTSKKAKEAKNYTQELEELKYAYTKKNDLSLELNKAVLEALWISELRELNILGPWKRSENFVTFVLQ